MRGVVAGLVVVALAAAVICYVLFFGDKAKKPVREDTKKGFIKEVTPAAAPKAVEKPVELTPEEKEKARRKAGGMYTNDYGYVYNRPIRGPVITNDCNKTVQKSFAATVFTDPADRAIGALLDAEPGTMFVGDPGKMYGPSFTRKFLKSIEHPIIVEPGDSEDVALLKKAVREAKIEMKARYDAGEDLGDMMLAARKELQTLGFYKNELSAELNRIAKDRSLTEDDMKDFVEAANKMLAERGASGLTMPRSAALRFERMRKKAAAEAAAKAGSTSENTSKED